MQIDGFHRLNILGLYVFAQCKLFYSVVNVNTSYNWDYFIGISN